MYAFNKRYRLTLIAGMFTSMTAVFLVGAVVMLIMASISMLQTQNIPVGIIFSFIALACIGLAIKSHVEQDKVRYKMTILSGRADKAAKPMEIING